MLPSALLSFTGPFSFQDILFVSRFLSLYSWNFLFLSEMFCFAEICHICHLHHLVQHHWLPVWIQIQFSEKHISRELFFFALSLFVPRSSFGTFSIICIIRTWREIGECCSQLCLDDAPNWKLVTWNSRFCVEFLCSFKAPLECQGFCSPPDGALRSTVQCWRIWRLILVAFESEQWLWSGSHELTQASTHTPSIQ